MNFVSLIFILLKKLPIFEINWESFV